MAKIGARAKLMILREHACGVFLDAGGDLGDVLLPRREMPDRWQIGGEVDVFLYRDSEDRPVATLKHPKAMPGEFAYLEVLASTDVGAFLDWGLPKDLLLPFREQRDRLEVGNSYVVHIHLDPDTNRIVASRRLARYFDPMPPTYTPGQEVDLLLYGKTELGYKAIINGAHSGVLYANQVFRRLRAGEQTKGYVTLVRPDDKVDLSLSPPGRAGIEDLETRIMEELKTRGGSWTLCDSSPPEEINRALGVSKKIFKQATGALFRKRRILINKDGIRLADR
jgi:predicted RNA-binding protein (virulence factor B family)